ncbi:alcohol dehydrogenase catalytic domain-containing protein [Pelagibius litoralis]|uniref:Alcohol dehydrogenase catalytic domain-containing protein n=1 Tax=Pelagibius litoralis TaxID=374515 RepID=A0A967F010_9PROT|nr:alcohol dehydrogenase catalytic domain-containing protein [Pelagibius litoralis]NIA70523.1 alcohol dehydrogenase catalytic domain-containing protein [Pelagibius litoralis]
MKATYYHDRAEVRVGNLEEPSLIKDTDAIVRVTLAGICGADLDFTQNGPEMGVQQGMRLGHEFVGVVEAVGKDVHSVKVGERVVASAMFVDGECHYCKRELTSACEHGGLFGSPFFVEHGGDDIQGGQSEFVRVPYANASLFTLPEGLSTGAEDAKALPLADNFATGFHGALNSNVRPGETVVVIGDGAVGQCSVMATSLFGASQIVFVGRHEGRLEFGRQKSGATHTVNGKLTDPVEYVKELTQGRGAMSIIDTIGNQTSLKQSLDMAQAGASISVLGFGHLYAPVDAPYSEALFRNLTIHTGIVNVVAYMQKLLPLVENGRIDPSVIFTDTLPLAEAEKGYALMRDRSAGTIKVALQP